MIYVVGSGPAGVACAKGLLSRGASVTLIDSGQSLEPEKLRRLDMLTQQSSGPWPKESVAFLKEGMASSSSGILLKLAYGSDFPYREAPGSTDISYDGVDTRPSYALGGLSTVWGAAALPYRQEDLYQWPVTIADLEDGYRAVRNWVPLAARADDLETIFPLYGSTCSPMLSSQASSLLSDLEKHKTSLRRRHVLFGTSRLAVNTTPDAGSPGCVLCGLCMYGCPHRIIYSSDSTLETLRSDPRFSYRGGLTIRSVEENTDSVTLTAIDQNGGTVQLKGERVFLAAGVLGTASILLRSTAQYDYPITLKDSQYFLLPLLRLKGIPDVTTERLQTLSQLFLEILDTSVSPYTIHLQLYTYNELFRDEVLAKLGFMDRVFPLESFLGRLFLIQGYLHSVHSPHIELVLRRAAGKDRLSAVRVSNSETQKTMRKLVIKLAAISGSTGLLPLIPMLQLGKPGRGFHSGGTFPMSNNPSVNEADIFGRINGLRRIHAVDSSVFPSIPATTITLTVMANAYRIGSCLEQYA